MWEAGVNHSTVVYTAVWRKFAVLMYRVIYSAVIGRETRFFVCAQYEYVGYWIF